MILVTGATGFLGGALIDALRARGQPVRALVRSSEKCSRWSDSGVEVVIGDVLDRSSLVHPVKGTRAVYYLVHAMGPQPAARGSLEELERQGIANLIAVCHAEGVSRVIYLGGLAEAPDAQSAHLRARWQIESVLQESDLAYTVFRAGMIIGRGSISFEALYRIVRDLPVIPLFEWAGQRIEPVALSDVLSLLVDCLDDPRTFYETFDVGGRDSLTYETMCRETAQVLGTQPLFVPVPFAGTRLTALGLVAATRIPLRLALYLAPSLQIPLVSSEHQLDALYLGQPLGFREAVQEALSAPGRLQEPLWKLDELLHLPIRLPALVRSALSKEALKWFPRALEQVYLGVKLLWNPI